VTQSFRPYEMIVFDAGGTLIGADWMRVTHDLAAAAADQGLSVAPADLMTSMRRVWQEVIDGKIVDRAHSPQAVTQFWNSTLARALTLAAALRCADGRDDPRACRAAQDFYPVFDTGTYHYLIDGAHETLRSLAGSGYRLGLLSNWSPSLPRLLQRFGIHHFFEFVIVSAVVGVAKPDRAIFDLALRLADCPPDRMLYVGDSPASDVAASRAAGWDALLIANRHTGADVPLKVSRLSGLPALLMELRRE
jgi:REG-2-like HAD superfamily hydrolase